MKKYRKRPVVIEAMRLTEAVFEAEHPSKLHIDTIIYDPINKCAIINTLEGQMTASLGDWIIKGISGELYPCKDDIFKKTYEKVNTDECIDSGDVEEEGSLLKDIKMAINSRSAENGSDTPDFILAEYLMACLEAFDRHVIKRDMWYGRTSEGCVCKSKSEQPIRKDSSNEDK